MSIIQPLWLRAREVPELPNGWIGVPTSEACIQLKPGKLYDDKTVKDMGCIPVLNQAESGFHGYHDDEPGVVASSEQPVVTFANHTCAMRLMREPFSCIQNIFPKVGKPGVCDTAYFYYTSQGRVNLADYKGHHPLFRQALIPLPPLPVQRRIAGILLAYDDMIENNRRRIATLEEMARLIYREWFVHFRFPGHEKVRFIDSPLGKIPEGWEVKPIGEIVETLGGGTPSTKSPDFWDGGDVIWFTPSDLTTAGTMFISDSAKKITKLGLEKSSARLFPPYSLMMTSRATIGVIAINTKKACTNQGFITCVPNEQVSAYQLYFWIEENKDKIISIASGATYKEINRTEFRELPIIVADEIIRKKFAEAVMPVCKLVENLQAKNNNLRHTRDLLLPRLISGEVDVCKIDINADVAI